MDIHSAYDESRVNVNGGYYMEDAIYGGGMDMPNWVLISFAVLLVLLVIYFYFIREPTAESMTTKPNNELTGNDWSKVLMGL